MESESHEGFLMVYLVIFCLSALLALAICLLQSKNSEQTSKNNQQCDI